MSGCSQGVEGVENGSLCGLTQKKIRKKGREMRKRTKGGVWKVLVVRQLLGSVLCVEVRKVG